MTQKPTGVFVRLPLSEEQIIKLYNITQSGNENLLDIGTPVTGTELYPIGYINEDAIRGLATGVYQSAPIFRDEDKEHYDTVALVRLSDAQAQLAARDAEIARLRLCLEQILPRASVACHRSLAGRESRLLAGYCADAREALKGGAA